MTRYVKIIVVPKLVIAAACARGDKVRAVAPLTRTTIDAHELRKDQVKQWPVSGKVFWSKD